MEHKFFKLTGLAISFAAISACGTQDTGMNNNDNAMRVGYYTNETDNNRDGMDNQGPIAELMEGMFNGGNRRDGADPIGNMGGQPIGDVNDQRQNNRGTLNINNNLTNDDSAGTRENRELSDKITAELNGKNNIDNARVLVTDQTILVSFRTDEALTQSRKNQIEQIVSKYADNRNVQITNDPESFMRNINGDNARSR